MKAVKLLLVTVVLSVTSLSYARYDDLEKMPVILGCVDFVDQASAELQNLSVMIKDTKRKLDSMRFVNKDAQDQFMSDVTQNIKDRLNQVKILIEQADKNAHVAL